MAVSNKTVVGILILILTGFLIYFRNSDFFGWYSPYYHIEYYLQWLLIPMFIVGGILLLREQTVGGKISIIGGISLLVWTFVDVIIILIEYTGSMSPVALANALFQYFLALAFFPILLIIGGVLGLKSDLESF